MRRGGDSVRERRGVPATHRPVETAVRFVAVFGRRPVTTSDALEAGFTRHQLRSAVRRGLLATPRHGIVVAATLDDSPVTADEPVDDAWVVRRQSHVAEVRAALTAVGPGAFATGESAAAVLGLATPRPSPSDVVTLCLPGCRDYSGPRLVVRGSPIDARFVTHVDGIPCTDLRRTAVDLARGRSLAAALIPLDAAARRLVSRASGTPDDAPADRLRRDVHDERWRDVARRELAYAVASASGWPGIVAARRALAYVEPAAESPLESRSRAWFVAAGLPRLEIGVAIPVRDRRYWADFCDRQARVIGEADGWTKYGITHEAVRDRLAAERTRQRDLEQEGWRVVRWTSTDTREQVVARMQAAVAPHHP